MDDDRIDFSSLELKVDSARFEKMVRNIVEGSNLPPPESGLQPLERRLVRIGRATTLLAAVLAVSAWLPALLRDPPQGVSSEDPVELVSGWAHEGTVPPDVDVEHVLGAMK